MAPRSGVGQCVQAYVGVRVPGQGLGKRNLYAAEHEFPAIGETMDVEAGPNPDLARGAAKAALGSCEVIGGRDLDVALIAFDQGDL